MEPWQSWGIVGVVGVGAYWYYSSQQKSTRGRGRAPTFSQQGQRRDSTLRDENKGRRKKENTSGTSSQGASDAADVSPASAPASGIDRLKKRKGGKSPPNQLAQSSAVDVSEENSVGVDTGDAKESDMDNKEFAQQLASLKTGTTLNRPASVNETKRTKKQEKRNELPSEPANGSKANGVLGAQDMSTASSTTGADADDDLSPAMSPEFGATQNLGPAGGVSDMLEAPSKGPSVMRLTEPAVPQLFKQPKQQKQVAEPETKKQRQNRQKNEERKLAREQAEKERRILLEKQLRTAREAEGRPAKNGLGSSKPPATNAWSKPANGSATKAPDVPANTGPLLDTFDEPTTPATTADQRPTHGTSADQKRWDRDLPSEEDQMRMLSELDNDGWNTVEKGGKGKKKATTAKTEEPPKASPAYSQRETDNPGTKSEIRATTANSSATKRESAPSTNAVTSALKPAAMNTEGKKRKVTKEDIDPNVWNRSNIHEHPDYDPEYPYALTGHPDDDDWAVV